jgi:dihydroorotate dehydrogenase
MKKIIKEDLNQLKTEEPSYAAYDAANLGLNYVGFGRYEDPKTQQVTHINVNDKLVPFNRAVKTNTFKANNMDDIGTYSSLIDPVIQQYHQELVAAYTPERYDDDELNAIYTFTNGGYYDINNRLSMMPPNVPAKKIEVTSPEDTISNVVESLDSAIKKIRAPFDFPVFVKLGPDYNIEDFVVGRSFVFKSYRNTTLSLNTALNSSENTQKSPAGRNMAAILQLNIRKNSRGMYISDFSANSEDMEFLLPRGTVVEIVDGPNTLVGSNAVSQDINLEILFFNCITK